MVMAILTLKLLYWMNLGLKCRGFKELIRGLFLSTQIRNLSLSFTGRQCLTPITLPMEVLWPTFDTSLMHLWTSETLLKQVKFKVYYRLWKNCTEKTFCSDTLGVTFRRFYHRSSTIWRRQWTKSTRKPNVRAFDMETLRTISRNWRSTINKTQSKPDLMTSSQIWPKTTIGLVTIQYSQGWKRRVGTTQDFSTSPKKIRWERMHKPPEQIYNKLWNSWQNLKGWML